MLLTRSLLTRGTHALVMPHPSASIFSFSQSATAPIVTRLGSVGWVVGAGLSRPLLVQCNNIGTISQLPTRPHQHSLGGLPASRHSPSPFVYQRILCIPSARRILIKTPPNRSRCIHTQAERRLSEARLSVSRRFCYCCKHFRLGRLQVRWVRTFRAFSPLGVETLALREKSILKLVYSGTHFGVGLRRQWDHSTRHSPSNSRRPSRAAGDVANEVADGVWRRQQLSGKLRGAGEL
jgi:hypothetical protein